MASTSAGQENYSSQTDAVGKLVAWMVAEGGFVEESVDATVTTAPPSQVATTYVFNQVCLSLNGWYFWIIWNGTQGMFCRITTSLAGGSVSWRYATLTCSAPKKFGGLGPTGGTCDFYATDTAIHARFTCVISGQTVYQFFSAGQLEKVGSWTGGEYMTCSYFAGQTLATTQVGALTTHGAAILFHGAGGSNLQQAGAAYGTVCLVADGMNFGRLDHFAPGYDEEGLSHYVCTLKGPAVTYQAGVPASFKSRYTVPALSPNGYNNRSFAPPVELWAKTNSGSQEWRMLGTVPGLRYVSTKLHEAGDVVNTDWHVYPLTKKGSIGVASQFPASGDLGIAFKFQ